MPGPTMLLTGARCGEAVQLASRYVDRAKEVWEFKPPKHKGEWRGHASLGLQLVAPTQHQYRRRFEKSKLSA